MDSPIGKQDGRLRGRHGVARCTEKAALGRMCNLCAIRLQRRIRELAGRMVAPQERLVLQERRQGLPTSSRRVRLSIHWKGILTERLASQSLSWRWPWAIFGCTLCALAMCHLRAHMIF